jgi:hypothetical protein
MIDEWWIRKGLEESGPGVLEELSRNLNGETEEIHEKLIQDNQCAGRDSNPNHPEYILSEARNLVDRWT